MKRKLDLLINDEYPTWSKLFEVNYGLKFQKPAYISPYMENDEKAETIRQGAIIFQDLENPGDFSTSFIGYVDQSFDVEGDELVYDVIHYYFTMSPSLVRKTHKMDLPISTVWKYPYTIQEFAGLSTTKNNVIRLITLDQQGAALLCLCSCGQMIATASISSWYMLCCPQCHRNGMGSLKNIPFPDEYKLFFSEKAEPPTKKRKISILPFGKRSIFLFDIYMRMKTYFFHREKTLIRAIQVFGHLARFEGTIWYDIFINPESEHVNLISYLMLLFFIDDVKEMDSSGQFTNLLDISSAWTGYLLKTDITEGKRYSMKCGAAPIEQLKLK
ncbi:MAG TPA: hypothetical protein VFP45_03475 [Candidatus Nitrosotalea sp.]|nr:hypothetical protein [Candidatus Nitrosotalea sp.]